MRVIFTAEARRDFREILERYTTYSPQSARRVARAIIGRIAQLEQFPDSGRVVPTYENRYLRELIEGNYRIIYERFADRVEVITIAHGRTQLLPLEA